MSATFHFAALSEDEARVIVEHLLRERAEARTAVTDLERRIRGLAMMIDGYVTLYPELESIDGVREALSVAVQCRQRKRNRRAVSSEEGQ